jgi:CRP/FNR family cyclic AMP-dependent transcriptional regulator
MRRQGPESHLTALGRTAQTLYNSHVSLRKDPAIAAAIALGPLRTLPPVTLDRLLANAMTFDVPRGVVDQTQGSSDIHASMLVSGLLSGFRTTQDGRQVTVRYIRAGDLLAFASVHVRRPGALHQQALTPCRVLRFHPDAIVEMTRRDLDVANLIAEENARRVFDYIDVIAGISFGSMRQRVVRHLLDLAAADKRGATPMVARVSQQALADAVGSVREVVVRLLRELREEGLIRTGRDEIELLQPDRLHAETFPREG